jgi:hypothetical protein
LGLGSSGERTFDPLAFIHCYDARTSYGKDKRQHEKNQLSFGNSVVSFNPLWNLSGSEWSLGRIFGSFIHRLGNKCIFDVFYDFFLLFCACRVPDPTGISRRVRDLVGTEA